MTVHLTYAHDDFHCLIDEDLFLPESWSDDRPRCRQAKIPDDVVYRPKSEIALEQHQRASDNGIVFEWLTFDEWYGSKPVFLSELDKRKQPYVGEIPRNLRVWMKEPRVTNRNFRKGGRGRGRKTPRLVADTPKPQTVEECFEQSDEFKNQPWEQWHVKDNQNRFAWLPFVMTLHRLMYVNVGCSGKGGVRGNLGCAALADSVSAKAGLKKGDKIPRKTANQLPRWIAMPSEAFF